MRSEGVWDEASVKDDLSGFSAAVDDCCDAAVLAASVVDAS